MNDNILSKSDIISSYLHRRQRKRAWSLICEVVGGEGGGQEGGRQVRESEAEAGGWIQAVGHRQGGPQAVGGVAAEDQEGVGTLQGRPGIPGPQVNKFVVAGERRGNKCWKNNYFDKELQK